MAYIMSIGNFYILWKDCPAKNSMDWNTCKAVEDWDIANMKVTRNIILCVFNAIHIKILELGTAKEMWKLLWTKYGTPGIMVAFLLFKSILDLRIPSDQHPRKVLDQLQIYLSSVVHAYVTTLLLCKYWLSFVNCRWCKGKAYDYESDPPVWMIDSGTSLHFTYDIRDFAEYQPLVIPIPIWTTNNITYVTGLSTIMILVLTDKGCPYTICLYPVYHILDTTSWLLPMGIFLLDNLMVCGNTKSITFLWNTGKEFLQFELHLTEDSIYVVWSHTYEDTHVNLTLVYAVDY